MATPMAVAASDDASRSPIFLGKSWRFSSSLDVSNGLSELSRHLQAEDDNCALTLEGISAPEDLRVCLELLNNLRPPAASRLASLTLSDCTFDLASPTIVAGTLGLATPFSEENQHHESPSASPDDDEDIELDPFADDPLESVEFEAVLANSGEGAQPLATGTLRGFIITRCLGAPSDAWSDLWRHLPSSLLRLDVSWNELSDRAVGALCGSLRQMGRCCPSELNLAGNRYKDVDRLLPLIADGRLTSVDLSANQLNDKSVVQLQEALTSPACRLDRLLLFNNSRISSGGLIKVLNALAAVTSSNNSSSDSSNNKSSSSQASLHCLAIDGTSVCDSSLPALVVALSKTGFLQELWVHGTKLTSPAIRTLLAAVATPDSRCKRLLADEGGERVDWHRPRSLMQLFACCGAPSSNPLAASLSKGEEGYAPLDQEELCPSLSQQHACTAVPVI